MDRTLLAIVVALLFNSSATAFAQGASSGGGGDMHRSRMCVRTVINDLAEIDEIYAIGHLVLRCGFTPCEATQILSTSNPKYITSIDLERAIFECTSYY